MKGIPMKDWEVRELYGWDANPYVWVIEFVRCEKPEEETPYQSILGR